MRARHMLHKLARSQDAAVAPTVAIALFGLVAVGGIAFDYARLATMDSELQAAADQAALAAATQLDGTSDSITRATTAANNLVQNNANFASDRSNVSVPNLVFYKTYDQSTDTGTATTTPSEAKFVQVTISPRRAVYALTPVVGAFNSGDISAQAVAGLGSAICKVPPLMICNPKEGATPDNFPSPSDSGKGVKLEAGGGGAWTPGNYGYLDFGSGAKALEQALGANSDVENCINPDALQTKPGNTASATNAINTRFDLYENGLTNWCDASTGNCSPALNARKDIVHKQIVAGSHPGPNCGFGNGSNPWKLPATQYLPDPTSRTSATPTNMGMPRDICHAVSSNGDCGGSATQSRFGDGVWDRTLYFSVNHTAADLTAAATWAGKTTATLTRYDVYKWELATSGKLTDRAAEGTGGNTYYSYSAPKCAAGLGASSTQKDRRILTVALIDCVAGSVNGTAKNIKVKKWVDVFLVEPSLARSRTSHDQIYGEIIGEAAKPGGGSAFQYYSRNKPYLIK